MTVGVLQQQTVANMGDVAGMQVSPLTVLSPEEEMMRDAGESVQVLLKYTKA